MNWGLSLTALTHVLALCLGGLLGTAFATFLLGVGQNNRRDDYIDDHVYRELLNRNRDADDRRRTDPRLG
jgi:hypothetical protein